jgi:hypothetical protein
MIPPGGLSEVPGRIISAIAQIFVGAPRLVYHYDFVNAAVVTDSLGFGPVKVGNSGAGVSFKVPRQTAEGLLLQVTRPSTAAAPVSIGAFATPAKGVTNDFLLIEGTFRAGMGPANPGHIWAVGLGFKSGTEADAPGDTRAAATLQHKVDPQKGNFAHLNAVGAAVPAGRPPVEPAVYSKLVSGTLMPFTLSLLAERSSGLGQASLTVDGAYVDSFAFGYDTGAQAMTIGAIGMSLTVAAGDQTEASVTLVDLKVYADLTTLRSRAEGLLDVARTVLIRAAFRYPRPFPTEG